jgi:hypothetical protein
MGKVGAMIVEVELDIGSIGPGGSVLKGGSTNGLRSWNVYASVFVVTVTTQNMSRSLDTSHGRCTQPPIELGGSMRTRNRHMS